MVQRVVYAPGHDPAQYRDLYGYSRDRARPNIISSLRYERARGRGMQVQRARGHARSVTIIFSLEIVATYDALASSCVVHVRTRAFLYEKKEERQFAREDDTCRLCGSVGVIEILVKANTLRLEIILTRSI